MKKSLGIILLFCLISFAAGRIDAYNQAYLERDPSHAKGDILYRVFGEFKNYMSDISDMQTDLYFHGGIADVDKAECGIIDAESAEMHADGSAHNEHHHGHHESKTAVKASNILLKTGEALNITEHYHISGDREKELLPWIYYSVKLNPKNEKTYVIGGYWLGIRLQKIPESISFLNEGLANNPGSWEINLMLGQIYLVMKKDYPAAISCLEKAKELGIARRIDKYDTRGIYTFLADAYAKTGNADRSIALYEELLRIFPADKPIIEKLKYFNGLKAEAK